MLKVYLLSAGGNIATNVGRVWKDRSVGDVFKLKSCLYPLHVVGKNEARGELFCIHKEDIGRIPFKSELFL